ncbi:WD40-repeat-containing domain protein [Gorgonomyces haynaldii]|nr:WD40-repeat-containing domain protein [Gorgonomyces haynaldii]
MHWFPAAKGTGDLFVLGGTDGKFYMCSKAGKVEKAVEAHKGATMAVRFNYEGTALLTAGEDGQIKIWSKSGMLRSTLVPGGYPVYAAVWAPDNNQILFTSGKNLVIKSLQPSNKPTQWKAHDGVILKADWNVVNGLIVSCGEDKKYRVWDTFGRQLYSSGALEHPVTSVAWAPNGDMFAVGSFNMVGVCDKLGWSYAIEKPSCGSIFNIAWTPDGTQMACAGGNGAVVFGHLINRILEWKQYRVTLLDDCKVAVKDYIQDSEDILEFKDRVVNAEIGFGYLIVATSGQCYIYAVTNWNTPVVMDLKKNGRVTCIQQCAEFFALVDSTVGIQIYRYDGRLVSNPKYPGIRADLLTQQTITLSADMVALKDHSDEKAIYLFDIQTGNKIGDGPIKHSQDITELSLNKTNSPVGRLLLLLDKNRDLYLGKMTKTSFKKLANMVETCQWNDENDSIYTLVDGKSVIWYYPNAVFVDEDILPLTKVERDGYAFGRNAQCVSFEGTSCTLRKADGSLVSAGAISPVPGMLQEFAKKKQWEEAIRICRHLKQRELWACLAAMSVFGQDLNTAEVAYANIEEIHKVQYISYIRSIPTAEGRAAEIAVLRKQPKEAESILLSADLIFRAIKLNIDLFQWDRALELALKYKTHVDTVLMYRQRYLKNLGRYESNKLYKQYAEAVEIDAAKIQKKMIMELENEKPKQKAAR